MLLSHVSLMSIPQAPPHPGFGAEPPSEFRIWAFGEIETTKGTFLFDEDAATSVMESFRDYGNRLTFDYEHAATDSSARAGDGKAAGSFLLELRADGLWAVDCRWTTAAAQGIRDREWLYFSPTFEIESKTGRILNVINIALTNVPATKRMRPLVAAHQERPMNAAERAKKMKEARERMAQAKAAQEAALAEMEGLLEEPASAAEEAPEGETPAVTPPVAETPAVEAPVAPVAPPVAAAPPPAVAPPAAAPLPVAASAMGAAAPAGVPVMSSAHEMVFKVACQLTGQTDPAMVAGALRALKETADEVPALKSSVTSLSTEVNASKVSKMVDTAIREMKLEPAKKSWALSLGMKNPKELEGYLATCKPIVRTSETKHQGDASAAKAAVTSLSNEAIEFANRLGVTPDAVLAQKQAMEARRQRAGVTSMTEDDDD